MNKPEFYECDCGARYSDLNGLDSCVATNHWTLPHDHKQLEASHARLLAALEAAQWHLMGKARKDPTEQEIVHQITAAIKEAKEI